MEGAGGVGLDSGETRIGEVERDGRGDNESGNDGDEGGEGCDTVLLSDANDEGGGEALLAERVVVLPGSRTSGVVVGGTYIRTSSTLSGRGLRQTRRVSYR